MTSFHPWQGCILREMSPSSTLSSIKGRWHLWGCQGTSLMHGLPFRQWLLRSQDKSCQLGICKSTCCNRWISSFASSLGHMQLKTQSSASQTGVWSPASSCSSQCISHLQFYAMLNRGMVYAFALITHVITMSQQIITHLLDIIGRWHSAIYIHHPMWWAGSSRLICRSLLHHHCLSNKWRHILQAPHVLFSILIRYELTMPGEHFYGDYPKADHFFESSDGEVLCLGGFGLFVTASKYSISTVLCSR